DLRDADGGVAEPRRPAAAGRARAHARPFTRCRRGAFRSHLHRRLHAQHSGPLSRSRTTRGRLLWPRLRPQTGGRRHSMTDRLAGKVAIVTGAGSRGEGIGNGKAASILFAREGARVVCADQVASRAEETVAAIAAEGGTASVFECDVSHRDGCQRLVAAAVERYGRLDILQNNVGIPSAQNLEEVTEEA